MLALVWGAVRARRAQVLTVLFLTALASAVASAGPWFAAAGSVRAAAADVASAPAAERTLSVRRITETGGDPGGTLDRFAADVRGMIPLPASDPVGGLVVPLYVTDDASMAVAYRQGMCDHLRLDGACPAAPFEAAISVNTALRLNLGRGDRLDLRPAPDAKPVSLRIVATYALDDPDGPYWSNTQFAADGGHEPAFTALGTFRADPLDSPAVSYDVRVPDRLIRGDDGYDLASVLRQADQDLARASLRLVYSTGPLLDTVARDRAAIGRGVLVAAVQVVVLAWFAIGLAGHYTWRDRRGDAALVKLRGGGRGALLGLGWGQHLVPLVLGALLGLPLGYALARLLAGPPPSAEALVPSIAAAGAVLVGGLAVLAAIEAVALRRPVADLLREADGGRGGWRSGLADVLLLAVAVAGIYQSRAGSAGAGLALAAPALVALAVALLLARLLGRVADRGGGAAVRAGRLRLGLTAVQVSRRPGIDRVFALVVVAVAVFATAVGGYAGERTARAQRSAAELGAARVLNVQAANRTALLAAVRAADPAGDQAMAVAVDTTSDPPVLAVDSGRLGAVARWRPEYGPLDTVPAASAPASAPSGLPPITGRRLAVRVANPGRVPARLTLVLAHEGTGAPVPVRFGEVAPGERTLEADAAGCAEPPGCRILRWELTGATLSVRGLDQLEPSGVVLDPARLGDIALWRAGTAGDALELTATAGALTLSTDRAGISAYAVDTALPLPVVLAGAAPPEWQFTEPTLLAFGGEPTPVRVVAAATALPVLGGRGVLVDLDATRRAIGEAASPGRFQVWLGADARPGIVAALTRAGLTVGAEESVAARARELDDQAPAAVTRFSLLAGAVALLLAAAALGVAGAVDRRPRLEQLRALRVQGLPARVAVGTAYAGTAALVLVGLLAGLSAAALARPLVGITVPAFTDGWEVLPRPGALGLPALAFAGLIALVLLGVTGWLAVLSLARGLRRGPAA
ncbi:ABC transporter permease [Actinoplanes sp. NPDC049668]|uniref:ABC transporter permease n=1 Tax=unclassified Actinoplanes TaxID=2626549 RepID=UPI0033B45ACD